MDSKESNSNRPNFFIVGAPKCATTALYEYLKTHPNIFMPERMKEPCFFSEDFPVHRRIETMDHYLSLFDDATEEHTAIGEASVWYLYSKVAIQKLYDFNPDAKLVVMLRNPVEQVYAMHMQCFIMGYDNKTDFEEAWGLQENRKNGKDLPDPCKEEAFLQYKDIASYSSQIERLLSIYPREQVKFILFDDLKASARQLYSGMIDYLELEDDNRQDFPVGNPSQRYKNERLGSFILDQPKWLRALKSWVKRIFRIKDLTAISSFIKKRNVEVGKRKPLSPEMVAKLKDEFREDVARVSVLIERDLSHWCE